MAKRKDSAEEGSRDSIGGSKKRKTYHAVEFKARKSPRFLKQTWPTPSTLKKKPETSEKQMGSTPLRMFEKGKNHVDVPVSPVKSTEKSVDISEESAEDGSRDSNVGSKKQKRYHVIELMADYKPQRVRDDTGSHTSEKHVANHDADATVQSQSIRDTLAIEEIASEHKDEVENVVSGDDAVVSSEPIGDISTKQHADIDMAPNDHSADVTDAVEDPNKSGSNDISLEYADGSHAVEDPNGTGPNHVAAHVEFVELGIPAVNCNREKALDTTPSIQQVVSLFSYNSMPAIRVGYLYKIEDDNMQPVEAIQVDQSIPEDSTLNPQDEPSSILSANPTITIQKINIDRDKEIAEAIDKIRL
nr:hypothetical protein [Tanacetum cinerariifolium]